MQKLDQLQSENKLLRETRERNAFKTPSTQTVQTSVSKSNQNTFSNVTNHAYAKPTKSYFNLEEILSKFSLFTFHRQP